MMNFKMGKAKKSIQWAGKKGNTVKLAGKAIGAAICVTAAGIAIGVSNNLLGGRS